VKVAGFINLLNGSLIHTPL